MLQCVVMSVSVLVDKACSGIFAGLALALLAVGTLGWP